MDHCHLKSLVDIRTNKKLWNGEITVKVLAKNIVDFCISENGPEIMEFAEGKFLSPFILTFQKYSPQ
jgi:hypothetical protein